MADDPTPDIDEATDPRPAHGRPFVPDAFVLPTPPRTERFWLEPLGLEHNEADYEAWTSSMEHIHATPGFESKRWPHPMTLDENAGDLREHADHFVRRLGFTYTVRSCADDDVIGCVYIYPSRNASTTRPCGPGFARHRLSSTSSSGAPWWAGSTASGPSATVDYAPR